MVLKRLQRHRQTTLVRAYCSRISLIRKVKRRICGIFSPFIRLHILKRAVFWGLISKQLTLQPLPFHAYYHSSLSANTRQTLAVVWE